MHSYQLVTIIVVLMTSYDRSFATADVLSNASEMQKELQQQLQQQQQQQQRMAGKLSHSALAPAKAGSSYIEQDVSRSDPAPLSSDDSDISVSTRGVPKFVGKRLSKSLSNEEFTSTGVRKRSTRAEDETGSEIADSVHSVAKRATRSKFVGKRAFRYEPRKAPWFIGKRAAEFGNSDFDDDTGMNDELNGGADDGDFVSFNDKRGIPRFVGKRDPYFSDSEWEEKRGIPRFVGKRSIPRFVGKRGRPLFVGKRLNDFINSELFPESSQLYSELEKRTIPRFVGKRNEESDFINRINQLSREAELREWRARIAKEKRVYGPRFVGKRNDAEEESMR